MVDLPTPMGKLYEEQEDGSMIPFEVDSHMLSEEIAKATIEAIQENRRKPSQQADQE